MHATDAEPIEPYELLWILPRQYRLPGRPDGFALEIVDFLGPGDPDHRGNRTVWVRGPVLDADLRRGGLVSVAVPHDQPRARRTGGGVLSPPVPEAFVVPEGG